MRTKALLCAAGLLAAGVATSMAQSNVYSLNVVGYVTTTFTNNGAGYTIANTPLVYTDNSLTNVLDPAGTLPNNTRVLKWDTAVQNFVTYTKSFGSWGANATQQLPNGTGYFVRNVSASVFNVTYVGEVPQGNLTNILASNGAAYTLTGSKVPQQGFVVDLGAIASNNDRVLRWDTTVQNFVTYTKSFGSWPNNATSDPVKGPLIKVGEGFFYRNVSGTARFERSFTVAP